MRIYTAPRGWLLYLVLLAVALGLSHAGWMWRWDTQVYDAHMRLWSRPPSNEIVIVGIDEESLSELGRWPWSRHLHARLLDVISMAEPKAIALDLIFAEPDAVDLGADAALAEAIRRNGRTVLPVLAEETRLGGQLIETLPIPELASVAKLGHVHVELDADAVARSVFLTSGLGETRWPSLGVAVLQAAGEDNWESLPGRRVESTGPASPYVWARDHHLLVAFAGPPGHFNHVSYREVLQEQFVSDIFRDKFVLVGVTATGLSDALPTPVSRFSKPMSGVEFMANVIDLLRNGIVIRPAPPGAQYLFLALFLLVPPYLYPRLSPRAGLLLAGALVLGSLGFSTTTLVGLGLWFPPSSLTLALAISYPLWSWLRLESAMRYLNKQIERLHAEESALPIMRPAAPDTALRFLSQLLPLRSWNFRDSMDAVQRKSTTHSPTEGELSFNFCRDGTSWSISLSGSEIEASPINVERYLQDCFEQSQRSEQGGKSTSQELLERRVQQVQGAAARLEAIRGLIDQSLAQMLDGVLIVNNVGQIMLTNERAVSLLTGDPGNSLQDRSLIDLLSCFEDVDAKQWFNAVRRVLIDRQSVQIDARTNRRQYLLVQMGPIVTETHRLVGLVVSLSDISVLKESERNRNELLTFLSHDLRSPLVSILSLLELTKESMSSPHVQQLLTRTQHYTETTLGLADQFLELVRVESKQHLANDEIDLVGITHQAIDQVWAQARSRSVAIECKLALDEAWVRGDGSMVERALVNLLINAIKYSATNSTAEVRLERQGECYSLCVTDRGRGIRAQDVPKLFDRFERVQQSRQGGETGVGLGLAIVKAVAERHQGRVEVTSRLGHGSTFCIFLPVLEV